MMKRCCFVPVCLIVCFISSLTLRGKDTAIATKPLDFIENAGQWPCEAAFMAEIANGAFFLTKEGFIYSYASEKDIKAVHETSGYKIEECLPGSDKKGYKRQADDDKRINCHAYKVNFINANSNAFYEPFEKRSYYHNYFIGSDSLRWRSQVSLYGKVTGKDIYPGIDVVVYSNGDKLKYDFIVAPQTDPRSIVLSFEGVLPELTDAGHVRIRTTINEVIEEAPYAYQVIKGEEVPIRCRYRLSERRLSYEFPDGYNKDYTLIIDPSVVFATYSGGQGGYNYYTPYATTYDAAGNLYVGVSITQGPGAMGAPALWPVTTGAFQTTWRPNGMGLNKYNTSGTSLLYSTYYGGTTGAVTPLAMIVNEQDELIIAGRTYTPDLPVTPGCYRDSPNGSMLQDDIFVVHFNSPGTSLVGATYIGGSDDDMLGWVANDLSPVDITIDNSGHIWVGSNTVSSDFPVTANALQPMLNGQRDGVVFAFNPTCSQLLYSSYLGGGNDDFIHSIIFNNAGNIVVCGSTGSVDFPVTPGVLHTNYQGGTSDGFVSVISKVTGSLMHATYLGTFAPDRAIAVQKDPEDHIYVMGPTAGDYPISPGVYAQPGNRIFIDKLSSDLSTSLLSTRLGGPQSAPLLMPRMFMLDRCNNIHFMTFSRLEGPLMPLTDNAIQSTHGPFWLTVLQPDFGGVFCASYYSNDLYGISSSTTMGVHRSDPRGFYYYSAIPQSYSTMQATPGSYTPFPSGAGTDPLSFKLDLSEFTRQDKRYTQSFTVTDCFQDSLLLLPGYTMGINHTWNNGRSGDSIWVKQPGVYVVSYNKPGDLCNTLYMDTIYTHFYPLPVLFTNGASCEGERSGFAVANVQEDNTLSYQYTWYSDDTSGSVLKTRVSNTGDSLILLSPGNYLLRIQAGDCDTILSFSIVALPGVTLTAGSDTTILPHASVQLWAHGATYYRWSPSRWLDNNAIANPISTPQGPIIYTVVGSNEHGCTDTALVKIDMIENILIPNAFSPNGDGMNDVFKIENFGYQEVLDFSIYNRWGERVFVTYDGNRGWDGTYNGRPADAGTYHYYIRLQLLNKETKTYKGDLTLIR